MPIYEYTCEDCGFKFEVLSDRWGKRCPDCGSKKVERRFSPCSWVFRGALEWFNELEQEEQDASRF